MRLLADLFLIKNSVLKRAASAVRGLLLLSAVLPGVAMAGLNAGTVDFGNVQEGVAVTKAVTVTNTTSGFHYLLDPSGSGSTVTVDPGSCPSGPSSGSVTTCQVQVTLPANAVGSGTASVKIGYKSDKISFQSDDAGLTTSSFTISVTYCVGTVLECPKKWNIPTSTLTPKEGNSGPSTISGTFVYDADSNTTSEVNVNITINGEAYALTASGLNSSGYVRLMAANQVGAVGAYVAVTKLTNGGGLVMEDGIGVGVCDGLIDQLCDNVIPRAKLSNPITLTSVSQAPGDLDTSFPARALGRVDTVLELNNGQYLVGGDFNNVGNNDRDKLMRLNSDGSLDGSFTPPANLSGAALSVAELSNGQYLVGGVFNNVGNNDRDKLMRLNS